MNPLKLLGWLVPASEREFVLGDLQERYQGAPIRLLAELIGTGLLLRLRRRSSLVRRRKGDGMVRSINQDFRYALRQLARRPGFAALAVGTLGLGIGATTAVFSVVKPVLLDPLPYPEPNRIATLWERDDKGNESNTGYATFLDVQREANTLESVAVSSNWWPTIQGSGEPERLEGERVTQAFFSVLGVAPALGRDFLPEENVRGQHRVVILSHALWQRRFGRDRGVIGQPITLDGYQYVLVGVMPAGFESLLTPRAEIWAPLAYNLSLPWACRTCRHLEEIGRLKPGITLRAARRELDVVSARIVAAHPRDYPNTGILLVPLKTLLTRDARPALLAMLGAVGLVLLIACANVSGLLLGRAIERESEFAIRGALGAGQGRVFRQLLSESVLLSLLGAAAGLGIAAGGLKGLLALAPASLPRAQAIGLDAGVLGFTIGLALLTGLLFGLVPALATARPNLFGALRPGGRLTGARTHRLARGALVSGEVALALMLLFGAGLLMRSLRGLLHVDPGFDPEQVLTMEVQTTGARYREDPAIRAFFERAALAVRAIPGVISAGWTSQLPLGGNFDRYGVTIEDKPLANPELAPSADRYAVTPGYLEAMRIPLKRGRLLTASDDSAGPPVALINEMFARLSWPGEDVIGKRIKLGDPARPWRTIVGLVGDVHHMRLDEAHAPQVYLPEVQWFSADGSMVLAVRTRTDPGALTRQVRAAIRRTDLDVAILHVATMTDVVSATAERRRFAFVVFQVFAAVAVLLAAAGIYGVLSGSVTERTREIGIRSALGASPGGVLALVLRQGLLLAATGAVLGGAGALLLSGLLRKLLFGVQPGDPPTFVGVVLLLLTIALAACWLPARRATRVSPLEALRSE